MEFETLLKFSVWCIVGSFVILFAFMQSPESSAYAGEALTVIAYDREAAQIVASGTDPDAFIAYNQRLKDVASQDWGMKNFIQPRAAEFKDLAIDKLYALNNFVIYGTPSTKRLLPDQRWQKLLHYREKYHTWPLTADDWQLLLSGRQPNRY